MAGSKIRVTSIVHMAFELATLKVRRAHGRGRGPARGGAGGVGEAWVRAPHPCALLPSAQVRPPPLGGPCGWRQRRCLHPCTPNDPAHPVPLPSTLAPLRLQLCYQWLGLWRVYQETDARGALRKKA